MEIISKRRADCRGARRSRARRSSCAPGSSTSPPRATSPRASSACRTTTAIAAMRTSAVRTSCGTCSRPMSSRSSRGAGVFRSRAASCIAATSTRSDAQRYARRLRLRGDDTAVGGVAAYSTLGHFKDPVLNTMLGWSDAQLAATLFHELAHQVVYVPGDSEFNEAFATVVEEAGLERWLASRGTRAGSALHGASSASAVRSSSRCCCSARERAARAVRIDLPDAEKRDRKQYRVRRAEARVRRELKQQLERLSPATTAGSTAR